MAAGEKYSALSFYFLMGKNTISNVVKQVTEAIIIKIGPTNCKIPQEADLWYQIADEFNNKWQFPFCIGSMDGKHVSIQKPPKSGSEFINYKGFFSIVLLAIVDANYRFIIAEVGCNGRLSDGGVWLRSEIYKLFNDPQNRLNIPTGFCLVADNAFPLEVNIMTPYSHNKI